MDKPELVATLNLTKSARIINGKKFVNALMKKIDEKFLPNES
ncbi:MAG TPA: hypothetical protein P5175_07670 [Anaerohalosphaeraceae bacterium]|nr:hypothetical protein [Anaerohalosphaeraceae bacterium]HRS71714.1 hypothetical protein [Anaerohalosphaeraceae bacterium]